MPLQPSTAAAGAPVAKATDAKTPVAKATAAKATAAKATAAKAPDVKASDAPPPAGIFIWESGEPGRLTLEPMRYPELYRCAKLLEKLRWTVEDVDLTKESEHWGQLSEKERRPIRSTLSLFATFDTMILSRVPGLATLVDCMEAQRFYAANFDQERVHEEAYMQSINAVTSDEKEREEMRNAIVNTPGIKKLTEWCIENLDPKKPLVMRLLTTAIIEGIMFFAFFTMVQWLRTRNILDGIATFNEFIMRDETRHAAFAGLLLRKYVRPEHRPARKDAVALIKSGLAVVADMIDEAIPEPLIGLSAGHVKQYTEYRADRVLGSIGMASEYGATIPFEYMKAIEFNNLTKTNGFERRVTQYQASAAGAAEFPLTVAPLRL